MMYLFIFFSFLFPAICLSEKCPISLCGNNRIPIKFPFWLEGRQTENCGHPGFNLSCNNQNILVLQLPYSGEFFVRDIDYVTQQIHLYDADNCLPSRLLSFNLSGSPFVALFHQNYTFLSCPTQLTRSRLTTIDCLSNSTNSVLATSSINLVNSMPASCQRIVTLPVPVSWPVPYDDGFSAGLDEDIQLNWYSPDCGDCVAEGGICGFSNNKSHAIGCFHDQNSGRSNIGIQVFWIICFSLAVPALSCAVGIAVFACLEDRRRRVGARSTQQNTADPAAVSPQPTVTTMGLDQSTIESYQKLVIGESLRLPGPNDGTCPICLAEYKNKETLRCIPECEHCFHIDCIDEWLQMNNTCPVCRNSPPREHVNSSQNI